MTIGPNIPPYGVQPKTALVDVPEFTNRTGATGPAGATGATGPTGPTGAAGMSSSLWQYRANTTATSGYPGDGNIIWNNATQTSATSILISHLTQDNLDIDVILSLISSGQDFIVQDANDSANYQKWRVSGAPTNSNAGTATSYWNIPVTLISSGGTGTTGFPNNHQLFVATIAIGSTGPTGPTGATGPTGPTGSGGGGGSSCGCYVYFA